MESYSTSYSSSNESSYMSLNTKKVNGSCPFQTKYSWLHSVRKPTIKKSKKAPIPPTPLKVYKVDPINFKELVQSLTCSQPDNRNVIQNTNRTIAHDDVPSPPVNNFASTINNIQVSPPLVPLSTTNNWYEFFQAECFGDNSMDDEVRTPGLLEMNLFSPTSFGNWCFVPPIMSPTV